MSSSVAAPAATKNSSSSKASSKNINNTKTVDNDDDQQEQYHEEMMNTTQVGKQQDTDDLVDEESSFIMMNKNNNDDEELPQEEKTSSTINNNKSSSSMKKTTTDASSSSTTSAEVTVTNNNNKTSVHQQSMNIERLTEQGVAIADVGKLKTAGIFTLAGIHMQCRKDLCNIKGLSEAKIEKIIDAAKALAPMGFEEATKSLARRQGMLKLTTGSVALDNLLGGGLETCAITEAFGEFRTGKSQLAHTLCVTCQLPTGNGGGSGKAVYVDTEGTFRPERIAPIANRFNLDPTKVLDNILVARAYTHEHQANLIAAVAAKMAQEKYCLLVVDSITALFRTDFSGRGELAERQQKLGKMMNQLMKVAEEFQVAVYITNQVVADPGAAAMFVADPKKPVGGHVIAHASTIRLSLRKGRGENRICKIYDAPNLPEAEIQFAITDGGVCDAAAA